MLRAGYDRSLATGVIAASGTLGQIIPPNMVLVVLGSNIFGIDTPAEAAAKGGFSRAGLATMCARGPWASSPWRWRSCLDPPPSASSSAEWESMTCKVDGVQILATQRTMGLNALRPEGMTSIAEGIAAVAHDIRAIFRLLGRREAAAATG